MYFEFNDISKKRQAIIVSAVAAILCGVLNSFFGEVFLAPTAAFIAALLLFESGNKRIFSILVPTVIIVANIFIGGIWSVLGIGPVILALIVYFLYRKGRSKGECVILLTVVASVFILASLYLNAANIIGSFDFEAVKTFYVDIYEALKADFINQMSEIFNASYGAEDVLFSEEEVELLFDSIAGQLISLLVVSAFVIGGITLKIFSAMVYRYEKEPHVVVGWRFKVTNVFAYFYAALLFANLFVGSGLGSVELVIINLYNIYMVVFAYFGFLVAREFMARGRSRGFATAMVVVGIVLLSALALQILSVVGLIFTIIDNKRNTVKND